MSKNRSRNSPAAPAPLAEQPVIEQPIVEQPVEEAVADEAVAEVPIAEEPAAEDQAPEPADEQPEQSVEDACAELGLIIEEDGHCAVEMLTSVSGGINLIRGDHARFTAEECVRLLRADFAKPRS